MSSKYIGIMLILLLLSCTNKKNNPVSSDNVTFGNQIDLGVIEDDRIKEASGLAASRKNPGVLWTHNDSGDQNLIFAITTKGKKLGAFYVYGVENRDWEDIAIGPGPEAGKDYLYIGDIGDNGGEYDVKYIYRAEEPVVDSNQTFLNKILYGAEMIRFTYPKGRLDAEALFVDPKTKDICIVTKDAKTAILYLVPFPQSTNELITLEFKQEIALNTITAGDISPDGSELLLKNYEKIYYWQTDGKSNWLENIKTNPKELPYLVEPRGEAICWDPAESGYFTLSEEANNISPHLYYYPRLHSSNSESYSAGDLFR